MTTYFHTTTRDDGEPMLVSFRVVSWGEAPQTSGPPERCHDGSPFEAEIIEIVADDGEGGYIYHPSDAEERRILREIEPPEE